MSKSPWFQQTPNWVWYSFIPYFGGLSLAYAGSKANTPAWIGAGVGLTIISFSIVSLPIDLFTPIFFAIWGCQVGLAFYLKRSFLIKTYPQDLALPEDPSLAKSLAGSRSKIDINACSKNDLVNGLGLPIVYANDIESLQNEGYIFTSVEELTEVVGIPPTTVQRIEPLITFSYNYRNEAAFSWKRLNVLSANELVEVGLTPEVAAAIAAERQRRGEFRSLMDVKKRTGLPLSSYRQLM
ncbi:helix-hairpin-helix domain-containing protein [Tumidithrix elongata RA019]|uniref:Helix-hairpin-helix domain-containing protein n=1 Tax=Tumidithrix elongata BACA0141 TaxID=2716417 RepID=A0AAW9PX51_9CYAN|nr:helix-hairpin-helix domain-containing protein [Tumidithrix elongata RA019]